MENGSVEISVGKQGDDLRIDWTENGGPAVALPTETGFGTRLVTRAIQNQLGGTISHDWREGGLAIEITIPLDRLEM